MITIERHQEVICALSNGDISNDLAGPLTRFSRSRHFWSRISQKWCVLGTMFQKNTNMKLGLYIIYRMEPLSMTLNDLWPRFQGHDIFRHWISQIRDRAIVTIEREQEVVCALSQGDISNDLDGPLTRFSRSRHFWSRISQKRRVLGTKLLNNTNRKPYTISNCATFNDLEWPLTPISMSRHSWSGIS